MLQLKLINHEPELFCEIIHCAAVHRRLACTMGRLAANRINQLNIFDYAGGHHYLNDHVVKTVKPVNYATA